MNDRKSFLRKVGATVATLLCVALAIVIGIVYGNRSNVEEAHAAGENCEIEAVEVAVTEEQTEAVEGTEEFQLEKLYQPFGTQTSGALLTASVYSLISPAEEEAEPEVFEVSTKALAQNAMETVEEGTLQLMASSAGSVWGGMIKVYAGETPLLITEEDKEVLLRIVEAEATGEDVMGRMLVANVILNRVVSKGFPNSIAEVVFQNNGVTYQFAPIKDGRYWTVKISDKTREAVERVLAGEDYSQGAMYFAARKLANKKAMSWFDTSLEFLFRHGVHEFFK
jgi:spore germination cell wall hydrolase CwlJ-like protein